jgi:REP element-mobilizing transposase RayT
MSFTNHNYHVVFSTKGRAEMLKADVMPRLVEYTGGIVRQLDGQLLAANGPSDHIHLLLILPPTQAVADTIRTIKTNTSKWLHETFPDLRDFAWQDGYASFAVSHSIVPKVITYICKQQDHHAKLSFRDELLALLKRHDIAFDEQYIQ